MATEREGARLTLRVRVRARRGHLLAAERLRVRVRV